MDGSVQEAVPSSAAKQNLTGIDVARFAFACLIPFLHIPFGDSWINELLSQYFGRWGVPFFFAVAGMLLAKSVRLRSPRVALARFEKKNGRLLLVWLVIYLPITIVYEGVSWRLLQSFAFQTPGYLWYLTAMLVAAVPFCLLRKRRLLYAAAGAMFVVGTLFSDTYMWLTGGMPDWYQSVFMTTRNGLMFALPMLCVGEQLSADKPIRCLPGKAVGSGILLFGEILLARSKAAPGADCSMYLLLPVAIYYLVAWLRTWNPEMDTQFLRGASTAIYLMQFGFIAVGRKVLELLSVPAHVGGWLIYVAVVGGGCMGYALFCKNKWLKKLFV